MPPKKGKKPAEPTPEEKCAAFRIELEDVQRQKKYLALETIKLKEFWKKCKGDLTQKAMVELVQKDALIEEAEERHLVELNEYKHNLKQIKLDHHRSLCEEKAKCARSIDRMQEEHAELENELRGRDRDLKVECKEQELACETLEKDLQLQHDAELTRMREEFETHIREAKDRYEKSELLREQRQDQRRRREVREIEERYNGRIDTLRSEYKSIKGQYFEIKNKAPQLEEQLQQMRKKDERRSAKMVEMKEQNKRLIAQLGELQQKVREDQALFKTQVSEFEVEMAKMANIKGRLMANIKEIKDMEDEHQEVLQLYNVTKVENAELERKLNQAIQEMKQKSGKK